MHLALAGYRERFLQFENQPVARNVARVEDAVRRILLVGNWPDQHGLRSIVQKQPRSFGQLEPVKFGTQGRSSRRQNLVLPNLVAVARKHKTRRVERKVGGLPDRYSRWPTVFS